MNVDARLRQLIEAERAVSMPPHTGAQGWERLASAVSSGAPGIAVPATTIHLTTVSIIAKSGAVAVVVGAIGTAAVVGTSPHQSHSPASPSGTTSVTLQPRVAANLGRQREVVQDAVVPIAPAPRMQPAPPRALPNKMPEALTQSAAPSSSLDDELQLIAQAKRELDRGQSHLAQVWLEEHRARFPSGVLSAEREGLLVIMACGAANSADTRAKADGYAARYPGSPLLDRIYRACTKSSAGEIPK